MKKWISLFELCPIRPGMQKDRATRITAMSYLRDCSDKEQRMEKQLLNTSEYILLCGKDSFNGLLQMVETNPVSRITGQAIMELYNSVPKAYRKNAVFLMNVVTLNELSRSLGLERDLISCQKEGTFTLMDKPIVLCNAMPFIMCKSISRFARNTIVLLETVRELKGLGVGLYFEEQNIDTMSGDGEFMLSILASFAQEESRNVSENCKWRVRKKFEQGIPTGFGMYGYEVRNGSFTIVPEEAEVVRRIFRMYLDGMGSVRIMKALIADNIPAPEGGLWNASVIIMMLRNEKYVGDLLLQKFFTNNHIEKKQCFNRGELPQYFVAEDHEPIIDRETFDAVQEEIARRGAMYTVVGNKAAADADDDMAELTPAMELNDRIHCGICGKKYRRKMARLGTPYAAPIWICGTYSYRGKAYCASKQIPEKILIDLLMEVLGNDHSADDIDHIEMHTHNRVRFVFADGHVEEHFWKDHSRRNSWNAEKRKRAAEKTKQQHLERKERAVR